MKAQHNVGHFKNQKSEKKKKTKTSSSPREFFHDHLMSPPPSASISICTFFFGSEVAQRLLPKPNQIHEFQTDK